MANLRGYSLAAALGIHRQNFRKRELSRMGHLREHGIVYVPEGEAERFILHWVERNPRRALARALELERLLASQTRQP